MNDKTVLGHPTIYPWGACKSETAAGLPVGVQADGQVWGNRGHRLTGESFPISGNCRWVNSLILLKIISTQKGKSSFNHLSKAGMLAHRRIQHIKSSLGLFTSDCSPTSHFHQAGRGGTETKNWKKQDNSPCLFLSMAGLPWTDLNLVEKHSVWNKNLIIKLILTELKQSRDK